MNAWERVRLSALSSLVVFTWTFLITLALTMLENHPSAWLLSLLVAGISGLLFFLAMLGRSGGSPGVRTYPIHSQPVRLELSSNENKRLEFLTLPCSEEQLKALAGGVVSGSTLTEGRWCGSVFSRRQFVELRDEMLKRHLVEWVSPGAPARGLKVTPAGMAVFRHLASSPPPIHLDGTKNGMHA